SARGRSASDSAARASQAAQRVNPAATRGAKKSCRIAITPGPPRSAPGVATSPSECDPAPLDDPGQARAGYHARSGGPAPLSLTRRAPAPGGRPPRSRRTRLPWEEVQAEGARTRERRWDDHDPDAPR